VRIKRCCKPLLALLVLAISGFFYSAFAQITFQRTYGGVALDFGYSVQETSDGGYILGGWTESFGAGKWDAYLIKVDSLGDTLWTRTYGDSTRNTFNSVQQTSDGGYIATGKTDPYLYQDMYLVKTDASGDSIWGKTYGGGLVYGGNCVQQTPDGGYIITGIACSSPVDADVCLMKTNDLGDQLWMKKYGGDEWDEGYSVQRTTDGGYVVAGQTPSIFFPGDRSDVYLIKTDSSGDPLWTTTYGGNEQDVGFCVEQTADGGYIVVGMTHSFSGDTTNDFYVVRTNALGESLWARTYGGPGYELAHSVQQTPDGGYIVGGGTNSFGAGNSDVYLVKLDSSGDTLWTRTYGGPDGDWAESVRQTPDGGYIIVGVTRSFGAGQADVFLIKTDGYGFVGTVRDAAVLSLDLPPDTTFTDSTYNVRATVRNFGNLTVTFDVVATVDGYTDTVQVLDLAPDLSTQVTFVDWQVPSADSTTYTMIVCARVPDDIDTTNDCMQKEIFAYNPTGVEERLDRRDKFGFHLWQNEPNPFHRSTVIQYSLATQCEVTLSVYDATGRLMETLTEERQGPGVSQARWDAWGHTDGVYFCRLRACPERSPELGEGRSRRAGDFVETSKMLLVR